MSGLSKAVDVGNSIVDAVQAAANNPLIGLLGLVLPQANSIIDVIRRYGPTIDKAQPLIKEAIEAGVPVFEKVVEVMPKFATAVSAILHVSPPIYGMTPGHMAENAARVLGGFGRMTPEQEQHWMNSMTPGNDPSQENSRMGSG